jgi:hypothetical protein
MLTAKAFVVLLVGSVMHVPERTVVARAYANAEIHMYIRRADITSPDISLPAYLPIIL